MKPLFLWGKVKRWGFVSNFGVGILKLIYKNGSHYLSRGKIWLAYLRVKHTSNYEWKIGVEEDILGLTPRCPLASDLG